jgi:hypothetical protein
MKPIELSFGAYGLLVYIENTFSDTTFILSSLYSVGETPTSIRRLIAELIDRDYLERLPQFHTKETGYWSKASYRLKREYLQAQIVSEKWTS